MSFWDDDELDTKRSLGIRDRQILYRNSKGVCQNPTCNKKIDFDEMQVGHKTAWSKGGSTTFRNSICLCYRCNKLQGTDSWTVFMKKQGVQNPKTTLKQQLQNLTVQQLKLLAVKHKVQVTGYVEESLFSSRRLAPSKQQYVNKLTGILKISDLDSIPKEPPKPTKKTPRKSEDSWF